MDRCNREIGVGMCNEEVIALSKMYEYNLSGRFIIKEMWRKKKRERITMLEGIEFLLD